jgi:hypothetical protein
VAVFLWFSLASHLVNYHGYELRSYTLFETSLFEASLNFAINPVVLIEHPVLIHPFTGQVLIANLV